MSNHKKRLFLILLIIIIINIIPLRVKAETIKNSNNIEKEFNIKKYNLGNDVSFKGVFSSHSWYFKINEWWNVNSVYTEIKFSLNQLLDKETYLLISVNNKPFYSQKIYYDNKSEVQNIKVNIPKDMIVYGSNELKVETYSRISDLPCVDDVNTANWIVLKGDSNIDVNFNNILADNNISNFPYPYLKENNEDSSSTCIVIPNDYTDGELSAALLLNSYFGKIYDNGDFRGKIYKYDDFIDQGVYSGIYIGNYENLPSEISFLSDNKENCTIKTINSPYINKENMKMLLIVSNDDNNLIKAIKTLMNKELVYQLESDIFIVDKSLEEENKILDESEKITFKDMGFNELNLKGEFRRSATLNYSLPKNRKLSSGDKIKIFMRYSQNLDFDRALVTIYINETPIGSKKLEKEKCNNDELELVIPEDIKESNYMKFKITFDLEILNSYCEKRQGEMPWALVSNESYLYTGLNNVTNYYFSNYGSPFIKDRMYNDTLVILPDDLTSEDLTEIGKVFGYLGKDLHYNNGNLKAIRNSNLKGEEKENNIIIYGTPEKNTIIKNLNNYLWFKFNDTYSKFISNEKLFLTDPFSSKISVFQLDVSPYNSQKAMLIITSPNEKILRDSLEYLSSSSKIYELNGDSVVIDEYGNIKTYKIKKDIEPPTYSKVAVLKEKDKGILIIMVLFLVFGLISGILYYLKYKSLSKGNQSVQNKNNSNKRIIFEKTNVYKKGTKEETTKDFFD
ncbi:cellulose biosynthesis cyclic di-GMP-binding regulatory protein BcsB [Clostridium weizhouense]|uniref:Cellulose biosynthesis cyclic di-GMP-binding regulatory protein BcsB n=1 Tax=Clostridium weizhouense TaxID=2859781 RepID=A0ABS7ALC8_9CLOT|nr:cellulose biosynthesis cyclic di-GMP-binding regulatory protein BcsB [Clostridium weizhouense]MBW6409447.1 cellulose biosynthesis cyclic di-GMP-binding regulatory protein BcsB [Clostridium weizhouense]